MFKGEFMKRMILPVLLVLTFVVAGCSSSGVYLAPGEKLVKFIYKQEKNSKVREVYVAGDFNDWAATQDEMSYNESKKVWILEMGLQPGNYAYKYVINGTKWIKPPKAQKFKNDGYGGKNAVVVVK